MSKFSEGYRAGRAVTKGEPAPVLWAERSWPFRITYVTGCALLAVVCSAFVLAVLGLAVRFLMWVYP